MPMSSISINSKNVVVFACCVFLFFSGCTTTRIVSSWHNPTVTMKQGQFKKVLVFALVQNDNSCRIIEDKLVSLLKTQAVPSHSYFTKEDISGTLDAAKEKVHKDGFDAIITIRLANIEKDVHYVPGTYPSHFYSPWSYGAFAVPMFYDPGYYTVDDVYQVETNLYTLNPDQLVWTGVTSTINPEKIEKAVDRIAKVVREKMVEDGFFIEEKKK